MPTLSVNVNKIATLRNARGGNVPNLLSAVDKIISCGVKSITCHPRSDQRHITLDDVKILHQKLSKLDNVKFNIEGDLREDFIQLVVNYPSDMCTLVPVSYGELTSHRGYKVKQLDYLFTPIIAKLHRNNTQVSIFIESDDHQSLKHCNNIGADCVEIYTKDYSTAFLANNYQHQLNKIVKLANHAKELGLKVNAGHDLTYKNIPALVNAVPFLNEISVGHHLICDGLEYGLANAIDKYLQACKY